MRVPSVVFAIVAVLGGCGGDDSESDAPMDDQVADDAVPAEVTWYRDVQPIVGAKCASCHQDGGIGPFALTSYEAGAENAARMLHEVDRGAMPPFDAQEQADCTPRHGWVDDPRLTEAEKAILHAWVDGGKVAGDPVDFPLPAVPTLDNVSETLVPTVGWATSGDRDQFVCVLFDPMNTNQLKWLTGLQVNPDNDLVVHHAVITELDGTKPETQQLVAERGIGLPFECGEMATPADFVVHIWTPGNQPMETNGEIAVPILPNAKLVMQIHYHPAGTTHLPDKTSIDMRYSDTWPSKMYFVAAVGNAFEAPELLAGDSDRNGPEFRIPMNDELHAEHMRFTLGALENDIRLFSVNPHMHLLGTHIQATIERANPTAAQPARECLANGGWNFDWQRTYTYDTDLASLPAIAEGDVIDVKCEWNNSRSNPFMERMLADAGLGAPIDITLGEQTTNEMCLEIFGVSVNAPPRNGRISLETLKLAGTPPVAEVLKRTGTRRP